MKQILSKLDNKIIKLPLYADHPLALTYFVSIFVTVFCALLFGTINSNFEQGSAWYEFFAFCYLLAFAAGFWVTRHSCKLWLSKQIPGEKKVRQWTVLRIKRFAGFFMWLCLGLFILYLLGKINDLGVIL